MRKRLCVYFLAALLVFAYSETSFALFGGSGGAFGAIKNYLKRVNADVKPSADNTYEQGSANKAWKKVWTYLLDLKDGNITNVGDIACDSITTGDIGVGTSPSYPLHLVSTSNPAAGSSYLIYGDWQAAFAENAMPQVLRGYLKNTGSSAAGALGHGIAVLGAATDTSSGNHFLVGTEGYVVGFGNNQYIGLEGHTRFNGTSAGAGVEVIGVDVTTAITLLDDSTPLLEGTVKGINVPSAVGGNIAYGVYVVDQTGANADVGVAIMGADTYALWIGAGADNTDAANGITFGISGDTNLYRSADNTLKTDDKLVVGGADIEFSGGTKPKKSITLTAGGATLPTSSYAELTNFDGTNFSYRALAFDKDSDEKAYWTFPIPDNFTGSTVTFTYYWTTDSGSANQTVEWEVDTGGFANDEAFKTGALGGTTQGTSDTWIANGDIHTITSSAMTCDWTAGDMANVYLIRDVSGDDLGGDAYLLMIKIEYSISGVSE